MKTIHLFAAAALLLATPALAKPDNDPGYKIMHDYVLTMPKVKAYDAAYKALTAAANTDPSLKAEVSKASGEHDNSIADLIGKMTRHPRIYAFFQKQGLSQTDAALMPLVLMDACTAAQYPSATASLADRMTQTQADFCKANMAQMKTMTFFSGG